MPTYTQSNRYLKVTTPLGEDALLLTGLHGHEALSQLFSFQLDLLAERSTTVSFDRLLGRPATVELTLQGGQKRYFNGIIKRLRQEQQDEIFTHFQAELTPRFWLWTKQVRSRVFQQMSVPDILKRVLDGLDVSFSQLTGQYQPRNYCVQYRESDFAFASRLMEDEGIYYYFAHSANGHQMILADASSRSPDLPQQATLVFDQGEGGLRPEERIDRWDKSQELCAGKYALWDHHFQLPGQYLAAEQPILAQATAGQVSHSLQVGGNDKLEIFDYPGGFSHRFDGVNSGGGDQQSELQKVFQDNQRTVRLRMEEEAASGLWIEGGGTYRQMTPGYKFTLSRHFNGDGPYVLSRVEHEAAIHGDYSTGQETTLVYSNRFRCLPVNLPYRPPRRTPRPLVHGAQTATVIGPSSGSVSFTAQSNAAVGPAGDDIFCDRYGRVKVQFRWDRENEYGADSSCWVRVNQPWAGQQWGATTLPRVGQEVVVSFLEGDPDRPLILGSVYNAAQMPPFPLPAAKTQAGIKAHSQGNGADGKTFSGLGFETALGQEHLHLHAERYMTHSAEQIFYLNAGQEHHINVGSIHTRQVGGLPKINHSLSIGHAPQSPPSALPPPSPPSPPPPPPAIAFQMTRATAAPSPAAPPPPPPPTGDPYDTSGPFLWNPDVFGGDGLDLDMVFGWRECNTAGLYSTTTLGQVNGTCINPLGFFDAFGAQFPAELSNPVVGAAVGPVLWASNVGVVIGGNLGLHLGPTLSVNRGNKIDANDNLKTPMQIFLTGTCALLYSSLSIADVFLPTTGPSFLKSTTGKVVSMLAGIGATDVALSVWSKLETVFHYTNQDEALAQQTAVAGPLATSVGNPLVATIVSNQAAQALKGAADAIGGIGHQEGAGAVQTSDISHSILAPQINLLSTTTGADATPSILLSAAGSVNGGNISIVAGDTSLMTGQVTIVGGPAASAAFKSTAATEGDVVLDCGTDGVLSLQSGIAGEPNSLTMTPNGITVSSKLQIVLYVEGNNLTMDPDGILLQSGPSSITITQDGIILNCGGNGIQITSEGVTITGTTVAVNSTTLNLSGTTTNMVGAAINIG